MTDTTHDGAERRGVSWNRLVAPYKGPDLRKSVFQISTTAGLFALTWFLMLRSLDYSYWITLLLSLPAAGLLIRLFIIQHDCGHGAFFKSRVASDSLGFLLGVLMLTPYHYWRRIHAIHHGTSGDLDRRGFGDVDTLTVREYLGLSRWGRLKYRLYRNAFVLFLIGPTVQFVVKHRFPWDLPRAWKREWVSVMWTNVALAALLVLAFIFIGPRRFLLVHLPIQLFAGTLGVWLFYIQHQFEDTYWKEHPEWDFYRAGLEGSSFYDLPRVLHWFTGNIGFHHIHHISSLIPNYKLRQCFEENPELHHVSRLSLWESLKCIRLKLWDEERRRLVGFGHLRHVETGS